MSWPELSPGLVVLAAIAVVLFFGATLWAAAVFWAYRDIRQRTRDPVLTAIGVMVVAVFFVPGLALYVLLRPHNKLARVQVHLAREEVLLRELRAERVCPECGGGIEEEYVVCPSCGTRLQEECPQCSRLLSCQWTACPFCMAEAGGRRQEAGVGRGRR